MLISPRNAVLAALPSGLNVHLNLAVAGWKGAGLENSHYRCSRSPGSFLLLIRFCSQTSIDKCRRSYNRQLWDGWLVRINVITREFTTDRYLGPLVSELLERTWNWPGTHGSSAHNNMTCLLHYNYKQSLNQCVMFIQLWKDKVLMGDICQWNY